MSCVRMAGFCRPVKITAKLCSFVSSRNPSDFGGFSAGCSSVCSGQCRSAVSPQLCSISRATALSCLICCPARPYSPCCCTVRLSAHCCGCWRCQLCCIPTAPRLCPRGVRCCRPWVRTHICVALPTPVLPIRCQGKAGMVQGDVRAL